MKFLPRFVMNHEPAAPLPTTSSTLSSGRCMASAKATPSVTAWAMPAHTTWFTALVAWPAPTRPMCTVREPMVPSSGAACFTSDSWPPAMKVSVPFLAPSVPPVIGASTKRAPTAASSRAASIAVSRATVEVSMTSLPRASGTASRSTISSTCWSADTHSTTASQVFHRSDGLAAWRMLNSRANLSAFAAVRFHTPPSSSLRARWPAMCQPIAPNPMNPALMCFPQTRSGRRQLRAYLDFGGQRAVHRALVGDLEQPAALLLAERPLEHDLAFDLVDLALLGRAIGAVLRVHLAVQQAHPHPLQRHALEVGVHALRDAGARAQRPQQVVVRAGSGVVAAG